MRPRKAALDVRRRLIESTRDFLNAYESLIEKHGRHMLAGAFERLERLEAGKAVTVPGWKLGKVVPELFHIGRYIDYVVGSDGEITAVEYTKRRDTSA